MAKNTPVDARISGSDVGNGTTEMSTNSEIGVIVPVKRPLVAKPSPVTNALGSLGSRLASLPRFRPRLHPTVGASKTEMALSFSSLEYRGNAAMFA